jgi:ADP-ribosylglycohydrolase
MEGWRSGQIAQTFGSCDELLTDYPLEHIRPMGKKVLKKLRPIGLHSDDTQQALGLLNIALQPMGWGLEDWGELLVRGMEGAWRGYGRNFTVAVHRLRKGSAPQKAGSESAGMGAAMRIAPFGGLFWDDAEKAAHLAMSSSLVTHGDIRAGSLSSAVVLAVSGLIQGDSIETLRSELPERLRKVERAWLDGYTNWGHDRKAGTLVSDGLEALFAYTPKDLDDLRQKLSKLAKPHLAKGFTRAHPNQGFVLLGGAHGLWMALFGGDDPQEILSEIVRQGFDTDTVAAIAGGVLGARFGTDWIPVERLLDRERLEAYANAMVHQTPAPESLDDFLQIESHWTQREKEYQQAILAGA